MYTRSRLSKMSLAVGVSLGFMGSATAENDKSFILKMDAKSVQKVSWVTIGYTYGPWVDDGARYNCAVWTPAVETINLDEVYVQSRQCSQNQIRTKTEQQLNPITNERKLGANCSVLNN